MSSFIPMVSSSPPPMDDSGGFDWDDDDDFGTFTGATVTPDASQTIEPDAPNASPCNSQPSTVETGDAAEHIKASTTEDNFADFKEFSIMGDSDDEVGQTTVDSGQTTVEPQAGIDVDLPKPSAGVWTSDNETNEGNNEPMGSSLTDSGLYSAGISPVAHSSDVSESSSKSQGSDVDTASLTELEKTPTEDITATVCDNQVCECPTLALDDIPIVPPNSHQHGCHSEIDNESIDKTPCPNDEVIKHSDCKSSTVDVQSQGSYFNSSSDIPNVVHYSSDIQVSEEGNVNTNCLQDENFSTEEQAIVCPSPVNIPDDASSSHSDHQTTEETVNNAVDSTLCECDLQKEESNQCKSEKTTEDTNCTTVMAADDVAELKPATDDELPQFSLVTETGHTQHVINTGIESSDNISDDGENDTSGQVEPCVAEPNNDAADDIQGDNVPVTENTMSEDDGEFGDFSAIESVMDNDNEAAAGKHSPEFVPLETPVMDAESQDDDKVDSLEHSVSSHICLERCDDKTYNGKQQDTQEDDFGDFGACVSDNDSQKDFSKFESVTKDESSGGDSDMASSITPNTEVNIDDSKAPDEQNSGFADFKSNSEHKTDNAEFGDFNTCIDTEEKFETTSGFAAVDETATPSPGGDWASFSEPQLSVKAQVNADAEWGEFDDEPAVQDTPNADIKVEPVAATESITQHMSKQDKVLYVVSGCFTSSMSPEESKFVTLEDTFSSAITPQSESVDGVWSQMKGLQSTNALTYQWLQSKWNSQLFTTLQVDTRNILIGHKKASVPIFASGLTLLEPTKGPVKAEVMGMSQAGDTLVDTSKADVQPILPQESIPPAQFDWSTSGLTNPLEATNKTLNLDFLIQESEQATKSNALESEFLGTSTSSPVRKSTVQPLENILANLKSSSTFKPTNQHEDLSSEARRILESLPHLNFMSSKVLMFPLKLDE